MKGSTLAFILIFFSISVIGQKTDLFIKKGDNGFYLDHKVVAKESFFSVGRLYNVHPRHLATFNKMDYNKGLFLDKIIRIPLTDTNFTQKGNKGTPVYTKAGEKDDWKSIAKTYKVSVEKLKTWNETEVKKGQKIIVGLLQTADMPAKIFIARKDDIAVPKDEIKEIKEEVVKTDDKKEKQAFKEEKKELVDAEKEQKKEEVKPVVIEEVRKIENNYQQGYFKTAFDQQVKQNPARKDETVTSGIFKTSSGWQDGKYYLLLDGVSPGTIVKISNPSNNRSVYAKVLGEMTGIRLNEGLNVRLSNAAAAALEIAETDKFILKLNY